jgi:hypothetical protein
MISLSLKFLRIIQQRVLEAIVLYTDLANNIYESNYKFNNQMTKAMNFTYLHKLSGFLYSSKSLGADESHNKGSFSELLLYI